MSMSLISNTIVECDWCHSQVPGGRPGYCFLGHRLGGETPVMSFTPQPVTTPVAAAPEPAAAVPTETTPPPSAPPAPPPATPPTPAGIAPELAGFFNEMEGGAAPAPAMPPPAATPPPPPVSASVSPAMAPSPEAAPPPPAVPAMPPPAVAPPSDASHQPPPPSAYASGEFEPSPLAPLPQTIEEPKKKSRRLRRKGAEEAPPPMVAPMAHQEVPPAEPKKRSLFGRKKRQEQEEYATPLMPATYPEAAPMPEAPGAPLSAPPPGYTESYQPPQPASTMEIPPDVSTTQRVTPAYPEAVSTSPTLPGGYSPPPEVDSDAPISEVMGAMGGTAQATPATPEMMNPDTGQTQAWTAQSAVVQQAVEKQKELADEQARERRAAAGVFAPAEPVSAPPAETLQSAPPPPPPAAPPPPTVAPSPSTATQAIQPLSLDELSENKPAPPTGQGVRPVPPEWTAGPEG